MTRRCESVIAVCSGKGGVGKTNVAVNLAVALGASGRNACLLDADVSLANVDVLLGLPRNRDLSHVVDGSASLTDIALDGPKNTRIIPAASGNFELTQLSERAQATIINEFDHLQPQPDDFIVDTAPGITPTVARFVKASQHAVVVINDEPTSLTDCYALLKVFSQNYGIDRFQIITNKSVSLRNSMRVFEKLRRTADEFLDVTLQHLGDVPKDDYLLKAVKAQRAVVDLYPRSASAEAFRRIARAVRKLPVIESRGGIEFFFHQMLKAEHAEKRMLA
ncbi:MAG: MinD/ParA family protein [Pseudomonadota bacterium]